MVEFRDNFYDEDNQDELLNEDVNLSEIREKRKAEVRKNRKSKQRAKEKRILSGRGLPLIKRLEKEENNSLLCWEVPKYVEYSETIEYRTLYSCSEEEAEVYRNIGNYRIVKTPFYMIKEDLTFSRLYNIQLEKVFHYLRTYDEDDNPLYSICIGTDSLNVNPGKYEYSEFWENIIQDKFGVSMEDLFNIKLLSYSKNKRLDKPRKRKYRKKLDKYNKLLNNSHIDNKTRTVRKYRTKERNILERASKYPIGSDEYLDLVAKLPKQDDVEFVY